MAQAAAGDGERGISAVEGMPGCSRLSCIKSAIECLVHREFHRHKRPALVVFPITYKGGHAIRARGRKRESNEDGAFF